MINKKTTSKISKNKPLYSLLALIGIGTIVLGTSISLMNYSQYFHNSLTNNLINKQSKSSYNENYNLAISKQNFVLNHNNAVDINENIANSIKSNSYTNAPEGYLATFNNNLKYMKYDNTAITYAGITNVISSYYDRNADCFVVLYSVDINTVSVSTLSLTKDLILSTKNFTINDPNLCLLIPVGETSTSTYMLIPQGELQKDQRSIKVFTLSKECENKILIKNDNLILEDNTVNLKSLILSAGAINIDDKIYTFVLSAINDNSANNIWLKVFKTDDTYKSMSLSKEVLLTTNWLGTSLSDVKNKINDNIAEIYLTVNNFDVFCGVFLNANPKKPSLIIGTYNIGKFQSPSGIEIPPSLSKQEINLASINSNGNYNIVNGRFFGDYFYGILKINDQRNAVKLNLKKFINESIWMNSWDGGLLNWDNSYTNEIIVLYDYNNFWTAPTTSDDKSFIVQPFYDRLGIYDSQDIFTYANTNNLYMIKSDITQYAYQTRTKDDSPKVHIPNVDHILAKNVTEGELNTYLTQNLFEVNITQYQKHSLYTIKSNASESDKRNGNIPIILTINNGYNSTRTPPAAYNSIETKIYNITLTGFAVDGSTIINNLDSLPSGWENILAQDISEDLSNKDFREYLFNNIIEGNKDGMDSSNIVKIKINRFDNKKGCLFLDSVTLSKWYNYKTLETSEKTFEQSIQIMGFKEIDQTNIKSNVDITNNFSELEVSKIDDNTLNTWINENKNLIFNNLPEEAEVTIVDKTLLPNEGKIKLELETNQYYNDNFILVNANSVNFVPLRQSVTINGFVKNEQPQPFPALAVGLGVSAGVIAIIAIILITYFYKKKKHKEKISSSDSNI